MLKTTFFAFALAAATATSAGAATAYLAYDSTGSTCTLATPCTSMQQALIIAGTNGEVVCLNKGFYGSAAISNSVTISCGEGLWEASGNAVTVNAPGGADIVIHGLILDGVGVQPGNAMSFTGQGSLHLHNVRIGNNPNANAILFAPSGAATLHVSGSIFYRNNGAGIQIRPTGSGFANVHMRDVKFERNGNGLFIDGSASTVGINVDVTGGVFAENFSNGIGAFSTAGNAGVSVALKDSQIVGNIGNGLAVLASSSSGLGSATIIVGSSLISGNVTGVSASGAGQIRTYGNNQLLLNGNNGSFTSSVGLQ